MVTGNAEIDQAGDAKALVGHAARNDAGKVREVRLDVEREPVHRHPAADADADGRDLVLVAFALVGPRDPHPDAIGAALAAHVEGREGADDELFEGCHIAPHVRARGA